MRDESERSKENKLVNKLFWLGKVCKIWCELSVAVYLKGVLSTFLITMLLMMTVMMKMMMTTKRSFRFVSCPLT